MIRGSAADELEAFAAVVDAADGRARPDWLATMTGDAEFRRRLDALATDLASADGADPGDAYQALLADDERAASGHFATDPAIATALCRWAVQPHPTDSVPRVLDPATGSGVFTLAAVDRLRDLRPDVPAASLLDATVGIDVDPVALAITAHRLLETTDAALDAPCHLYEADFLDVDPGAERSVSVRDSGLTAGQFDAVVGNPPYVRQETVDIDDARSHLASFGPDGETPYLDGDRALSRRSDAYVYFLTQATRFLRDGGRLGVVVPSKWLTTQYGESFQRFLFDHFRIDGVVGFGSRAFGDALVDTVLLFAERCECASRRRSTPVRFCRVDSQLTVPTLLSALEPGAELPDAGDMSVREGDGYRVVTVRQATLAEADVAKLTPYLQAPPPFIRLLANPALTTLGELGSMHRGVMTGANDFFLLDADGRAAEIDDRFCRPAIKSIRDVDGRVVTAADTDRYLLDVHDYVTAVRAETGGADLAAAVTGALARDGYDALAEYVAWGRRQGYDERQSCQDRRVWFDLGEPSAPAVFVPKFFDERVHVVANPDGLVATNAVDCLWLDDAVDERVVLGVLDATVTKALLECWGRSEGGGALQVMTYEFETLPVPDPRTFDADTRAAIAAATESLLAGDDGAADRLDRLVLDAVDPALSADRCRRLRNAMVDRRRQTGVDVTNPLVTE